MNTCHTPQTNSEHAEWHTDRLALASARSSRCTLTLLQLLCDTQALESQNHDAVYTLLQCDHDHVGQG